MAGVLYVVGTPIGNRGDLSGRAEQVLRECALIVAEDTRHSRGLLGFYGIETRLMALHEHNEAQKVPALIERLLAGDSIALVSDAGTPLIADPGYRLVSAAHEAEIQVCPVPGPCAAIAALSASGLATDQFHFVGFLPSKGEKRRHALESLKDSPETLIFYEAPHRILALFDALIETFGEARLAVLAKELTKTFETVRRDALQNLRDWLLEVAERQKGEFVVLVSGAPKVKTRDLSEVGARTMDVLMSELSVKTAAKLAAELTGESKNLLYAYGVGKG